MLKSIKPFGFESVPTKCTYIHIIKTYIHSIHNLENVTLLLTHTGKNLKKEYVCFAHVVKIINDSLK